MSETLNPRQAYGEALLALGRENPAIVALEADLGKSTMSNLFGQEFPDRYFEMGIAEQNMLSTAAGLAAGGKIAFCSTFSVFISGRAYDQARQTIAIGRLNVKLCGSSAGLSDFGDGSTHQSVEDAALMCAIPGMTVFTPCDAYETKLAVRAAAETEGPVFIRVVRNDLPALLPKDAAFSTEPRFLREGTDILILSHGSMTSRAIDAAKSLETLGISAAVANVGVLKPFSYALVADLAARYKAVLVAEDHSYHGGLTAATALALRASAVPMDYVAIEDSFGQSAKGVDELMAHYGLTAENMVKKAVNLLKGR
jgi:transketolase